MAPDPNSSSGGDGSGSAAREDVTVKVPSKHPKKKEDKKDEYLLEEYLALKQQLELCVERVQDHDPGLQKVVLESMRQEIRSATSSMTSVPKPLKFLRPHYGTLKTYYETMPESDLKSYLAAILSVLALTMSSEGERESLKYRLLGSQGDIGSWGHEYVRNLAGEISQEYSKRQVQIAQGLVHLGKGLLTLNPYHSERFLLSPAALAGLLTMLRACLDMKVIILGKYHKVLCFLVLAMQLRMLMTVDENLKPLSVPVRVGQSVDVVGQAGRPKTITGFQTHSTPVLLSAGDRTELASGKYIPLSPMLKGFIILKENPDY